VLETGTTASGEGRDPVPPSEEALSTADLIRQVGWFIRLRWVAVLTMATGTLVGRELRFPVPVLHLLLLALTIAVYNIILRAGWKRLAASDLSSPAFFRTFCTAQIVLDYLALTVTIHFTGGIESPVTIFFVFHIIVAALLLPGRSAYMDAFLASILVGLVTVAEGTYRIPHFSVLFHNNEEFFSDFRVAGAWYLFLVLTFFISSFIAATIGNSLERKIEALVRLKRSLEEANRMLKIADREKTDFLNLVTHELRSPMVAIRGILQALSNQYAGKLNPEQLQLLTRADRRAQQMIEMVNDLLRLAQTRSDRPREKTPFDLREEVENVVELFRPQAVQAGIDLALEKLSSSLVIKAERNDIRYVMTNLVSNAVKYTPPGGKVRVRLARKDDRAVVEVTDTGIGIPEKELPRLFTEFFRASNAKKQHVAGTGLGLVISRKMITSHGGTIEVESEFGKGSTFTVTLPLHTGGEDSSGEEDPPGEKKE